MNGPRVEGAVSLVEGDGGTSSDDELEEGEEDDDSDDTGREERVAREDETGDEEEEGEEGSPRAGKDTLDDDTSRLVCSRNEGISLVNELQLF